MKNIPETHRDLLTDDKKAFAYLATAMKDGSTQVTPVWFNTDGEYILLNTVINRIKDKNMSARPHIAICIADPSNPYRYLQLRGVIIERTIEGAEAHIDTLSMKYRGEPVYDRHRPDLPRVIHKLRVEKVDPH
jgi:PPOX class probable F420-dependent enzyme